MKCLVPNCPDLTQKYSTLCNYHYGFQNRRGYLINAPKPEFKNKSKCFADGCEKSARANGYCESHNHKIRRFGRLDSYHTFTNEYRIVAFWSKVAISPDFNKCWEWQAKADNAGYGRYSNKLGGIKWSKAHRAAFYLANGVNPGELKVCHKCDNPPCCNPNHLFLGTLADNNIDRTIKGRGTKGSRVPNAKLTEEKVVEIRQRLVLGEQSKKLALEFGVSTGTMAQINKGRTWKHCLLPSKPEKESQKIQGMRI